MSLSDYSPDQITAFAALTAVAIVPQAGIALALAATVAETYPKFGETLATVVIGTVVLNEAIGPFFLRSALRSVGETASTDEVLH